MDRTAQGRRAEDICADYLFARGYELVGRNVRVGARELDILAARGDVLAVVEVRTRSASSYERALQSVGWQKRKHLVAAAGAWLRQSERRFARVRFDVAAVSFDTRGAAVEHVEGAFTR